MLAVCLFPQRAGAESAPYTTRSDFAWGVNGHHYAYQGYPEEYLEEQIHLAAELGCKIYRTGGDLQNLAWTDKMVSLCNAYGMQVMMCIPLTLDDHEYTTLYFNTLAERYNGKDGRGKVDYFQISNEHENELLGNKWGGMQVDGTKISDYYLEDLEKWGEGFKAAIKGIRSADTDAKSVINIAYTHYGCLEYYVQNGVDFDVIGLDWYSNMKPSIKGILDDLCEKFDKDIIICESNIYNEPDDLDFDNSSYEQWQPLLNYMEEAYAYPEVKGYIVYELLDEPYLGAMEALLGLVQNGINGEIGEKKAIYYEIQKRFGGGTRKMLTEKDLDLTPYEKLTAQDPEPEPTVTATAETTTTTAATRSTASPSVTAQPTETTAATVAAETTAPSPGEVSRGEIVEQTNVLKEIRQFPWLWAVVGSVVILGGAAIAVVLLLRKKGGSGSPDESAGDGTKQQR